MNTELLRVLLIEDVPAEAELCAEAFQNAGFSIRMEVCSDPRGFETLIASTDYDVVLTEYELAKWNGIEAIEMMRRLGRDIPIVILTRSLGDEIAVECIRLGAADYVRKDRLSSLPFIAWQAMQQSRRRVQERLLAAAFADAAEGMLITDAAPDPVNATVLFVNKAFSRITGYNPEDLIGKPLSAFQTTETGAALFANCESKLMDRDCLVGEMTQLRKNGSPYEAEWRTSVVRDRSGRISNYIVLHRDITERKGLSDTLTRTNDALIRSSEVLRHAACRAEGASRAKSDFLAYISHEIRTPMNMIVGMADLLLETRLTQRQAKYVEVFQRAGEDLLALVNQILDLSKIESGKFELEHIDFDLNAVLSKTISLFEVPTQAKGLALSFHVAQGTPTRLVGDPHQLQQVLNNLIGNAVKFTQEGSITVEARLKKLLPASNCSLELTVSDTGIGIPDDKKAMVFENFTQAESSIPRLYGGTGLGLAICRALVERMHGTIEVESVPGSGSSFRFTASFKLQLDRPKVASDAGSWKVLLCEDSQDNAFLVNAYLESSGYDLHHVADGKAGLERFKNDIFNLVLMDIQMPVMDGYAATRGIRQWEAEQGRSPTPILALTANADKQEPERCQACGCTGFLTKPVRKTALLAAMAELLPHSKPDQDQCELPANIRELVPGYLKQKRTDLDRLWTAIDSADYATISTVGHQLKATGAAYGFEDFSDIGGALEHAGRKRDLGETRSQAERFAESMSVACAPKPTPPVTR